MAGSKSCQKQTQNPRHKRLCQRCRHNSPQNVFVSREKCPLSVLSKLKGITQAVVGHSIALANAVFDCSVLIYSEKSLIAVEDYHFSLSVFAICGSRLVGSPIIGTANDLFAFPLPKQPQNDSIIKIKEVITQTDFLNILTPIF